MTPFLSLCHGSPACLLDGMPNNGNDDDKNDETRAERDTNLPLFNYLTGGLPVRAPRLIALIHFGVGGISDWGQPVLGSVLSLLLQSQSQSQSLDTSQNHHAPFTLTHRAFHMSVAPAPVDRQSHLCSLLGSSFSLLLLFRAFALASEALSDADCHSNIGLVSPCQQDGIRQEEASGRHRR